MSQLPPVLKSVPAMHEIDHRIHGDDMQYVEIGLDPGEAIVAELGKHLHIDAQLIEQVIGSSASVALRNTLMCLGGVVMLVAGLLSLMAAAVAAMAWWQRRPAAAAALAETGLASMVGAAVAPLRRGTAVAVESPAQHRVGSES